MREMVDAGISLDSALKTLQFPPPGPRPLLSQDERSHAGFVKGPSTVTRCATMITSMVSGILTKSIGLEWIQIRYSETLEDASLITENTIFGKTYRRSASSSVGQLQRKQVRQLLI